MDIGLVKFLNRNKEMKNEITFIDHFDNGFDGSNRSI